LYDRYNKNERTQLVTVFEKWLEKQSSTDPSRASALKIAAIVDRAMYYVQKQTDTLGEELTTAFIANNRDTIGQFLDSVENPVADESLAPEGVRNYEKAIKRFVDFLLYYRQIKDPQVRFLLDGFNQYFRQRARLTSRRLGQYLGEKTSGRIFKSSKPDNI
jgi:hypothetical protein